MPLGNASKGDADYVTTDEWFAMAQAGTLVMFRVLDILPPETLNEDIGKPAEPVRADVYIATGPRKGDLFLSEKLVGAGFTGMLRREKPGAHVAAQLVPRKRGATKYAAANTCTDDQLAELMRIYSDMGENPWDQRKKELQSEGVKVPDGGASGDGDDDDAPF
jgi:hypothetical protein